MGLPCGFMDASDPNDDARTVDAEIDPSPSPSARAFRLRAHRAELITDAPKSRHQSRRHRRRWYTILQLSRLPTMALSGLAYFWWENIFWTVFFFILAVPAPAVAVIFANETNEKKDKRTRNTYKPALARQLRDAHLREARAHAQLASPAERTDSPPVVIDHEEPRDP